MATTQLCPPIPSLPPLPLPEDITSSYIRTPSLTYHILSSGAPTPSQPTKKPLILLLHGFPELAYSWRKIMPSLATVEPTDLSNLPQGRLYDDDLEFAPSSKDGYHVVAYDQRGYGRTTGWDTRGYHEVDLNSFRMTEVVKDAVRLVYALGYEECACIVGHDFGAVGAALAAVIRPDVFKK